MFGAIIRGVGAYVAGILLWTPLEMFERRVISDFLEPNLPSDSVVIWSLESAVTYWPLLLLFIVATFIVARSIVESNLGGPA